MLIYHTSKGVLANHLGNHYLLEMDWDELFNAEAALSILKKACESADKFDGFADVLKNDLLPPVNHQEIWASGVTYYRSREARMEESKDAGGGDFYDRVYYADRPELFFKSPSYRAVGHGGKVRIRKDSAWNVPEPELTLVINKNAKLIGYTIGNDMSSRDIEGENPLYLPQAKSYDGSTAIGPGIFLTENDLPGDTEIAIEIIRDSNVVFNGATQINQIKRSFQELIDYLFRETTFPYGCLLMTGTGVVPPDEFTLQQLDEINITIQPIGTLSNTVKN